MANKWSPSTPSPVGGGIIEASVARHPGCSWRVFSPAGFHSLGCPAQERYFVDFGARGDVEDGALPPRLPSLHRLLTHMSSTSGDCERSSIMARKSSASTPPPVGGGIIVVERPEGSNSCSHAMTWHSVYLCPTPAYSLNWTALAQKNKIIAAM